MGCKGCGQSKKVMQARNKKPLTVTKNNENKTPKEHSNQNQSFYKIHKK